MSGKKKKKSPILEAYDVIANAVNEQQSTLKDPAHKIELSLLIIAQLTAQIVETGTRTANANLDRYGEIMADTGHAIGTAVEDGYTEGTANGCPCGECEGVEVKVSIRPVVDPHEEDLGLDPTPAPKGTVFN